MPPSEFSLRMQHGIAGGFAPPTPSAVYALNKSQPQTHILIESFVRPDGTPELQSAGAKALAVTDVDDHAKLVEELHGILKAIPVESPIGSQDIYGLDTSIFWASEDLQWQNGGPAGCSGGMSEVQPTEEQITMFKRAVAIVTELVNKAT